MLVLLREKEREREGLDLTGVQLKKPLHTLVLEL